ncbi:hypothetical protein [Oscillatoria sp. HE19RPO]|uniref:hypothetical protein n=1 Tax=Oscillatoria sp. HE19RPO TaxID=2954806 RepID=UPI0020C2D08E|nr:hypothetical protein [Oscillatoria sp. HE19RPO]
MEKFLRQLDEIEAIVDTVSPSQIEREPFGVATVYQLYANSYDPLDRVKELRNRLIEELEKGKSVNGYLSADYGYGKTATLIYLWSQCQQNQIVAVPPFKFKEVENLMVATYAWIKAILQKEQKSEFLPELDALYDECTVKSLEEQAVEIASKYKLSREKALKIVQEFNTEISPDSVLLFWQETIPIIQKAGFRGLAIFADESQEFLRTEEGASARIQVLSDLIKGMRSLGKIPIALMLGMPTTPTESAIDEQAGDIIHRMKEQKVSLRLADAYTYEFPGKLWTSLCVKFLGDQSQGWQLAHPATIESLSQLCDRKDLSSGPRTVIEVFKRIVRFYREHETAYTPVHLIQDYLEGRVEFYGVQQHKINNAIATLELLPPIIKHPQGLEAIKLMAMFPAGVSATHAKEFGVLKSISELANDDNLSGLQITQPTEQSFALAALKRPNDPTVVDKILNRFRQNWFGTWNDVQKQERATVPFMKDLLPLLFPASISGQKANWNWPSITWKQDRFGFFNVLTGAPERHHAQFPNRSLTLSVGNNPSELMQFVPPQPTHLDWRFYLSYDGNISEKPEQRLTAIAGTGQVDFHLQLARSFGREYPPAFGLLNNVIPPEQCSACTLLSLSQFIQDWLVDHSDISKSERARLEHHRRECHQYALRLLFPAIQSASWKVEGLEAVEGADTKLIESVFYQKCQSLFPEYQSFYSNLRPTVLKYKLLLEKLPLAVRRGRETYQAPKEEFEQLFETSGSGLGSILAVLSRHALVVDYKIANQKEKLSRITFTEHPLESFIQSQLESKGRMQTVETVSGIQEVKALAYPEVWKTVSEQGYLELEFQETLEWLQRRRYVEWDRKKKIVRQSVAELDANDLSWSLNQLSAEVASLLEVFNDPLLHEISTSIEGQQQSLAKIVHSLEQSNQTRQLPLFEQGNVESSQKKHGSEIALDQFQRTIQLEGERLVAFCSEKKVNLQQYLNQIKVSVKQLTADFNGSKVNQILSGNSGVEACLDDHRKVLEREVNQLKKECETVVKSIEINAEVLSLFRQIEQCQQEFERLKQTKDRLQPLVAGLEEWRIILNRAGKLKEELDNQPERLRRYEDEFVDRVVEYFNNRQVEGFLEYELLQRPLLEIEEQMNSERRSQREAFEVRLNKYEGLLTRLDQEQSRLSLLCRYDDEDSLGSYETLNQVFLEQVQEECDRRLSQREKLERDLSFLRWERQQDVTELCDRVTELKDELDQLSTDFPKLITDINALEAAIEQLHGVGAKLDAIQVTVQEKFEPDASLAGEEKQILEAIASGAIVISQLRSSTPESLDLWKQLKTLYEKGHVEITLSQRESQ